MRDDSFNKFHTVIPNFSILKIDLTDFELLNFVLTRFLSIPICR